jgi:hypothetical protein
VTVCVCVFVCVCVCLCACVCVCVCVCERERESDRIDTCTTMYKQDEFRCVHFICAYQIRSAASGPAGSARRVEHLCVRIKV